VQIRRASDGEQRLAGLFVVIGATFVFGPIVWLLEAWSASVARDPAGTWGAPWLGERLSAHPYLTGGALILGATFSSGLVMMVLVGAARRLATRLTERPRLREAEQLERPSWRC
jgi:hypothetical protein